MTKKNIAAISILLLILLGAIYIGLGRIGLGNIGRENALRLNQPRTAAVKLLDAKQATLLFALLHNYNADSNKLAVSLDKLAPRLDLTNVLDNGVELNELGVTLNATNLNV